MGVVYEAIQLSLNRKVALKVLPWGITSTGKDVARFRREAEAAAKLHHTNIVPIYAQGEHQGTYYYAMQYIEGRSLDKVITDAGGLDFSAVTPGQFTRTLTADTGAALHLEETVPAERAGGEAPEVPPGRTTDLDRRHFRTAARMVAEVAEALEYAHGEGVIHRDIKPHNLMLTSERSLMITDFGLARFLDQPGVTVSGEMMGTPVYMSPEQVAAQRVTVDHRTDIYSLGVTLYELLTLQLPFQGDTREAVLRQILMKDPPPPRRLNRRIPKDLETICLKAMEKDPDKRYERAQDFARDLRCFLEGLPIVARPIGPVGRLYRRALRRKAVTAAIAGAVLAVIMMGIYSGIQAYRSHQREAEERLRAEAEAAAKFGEQRGRLLAEAASLTKEHNFAGALPRLKEAASIKHDHATLLRLQMLAGLYSDRPLRTLGGHTGPVYSIALSPDGKTLASGSADTTIRFWDVATGTELRTLTGHAGLVFSVAFSPDGKTLASGGEDRTVRLWDVGTGMGTELQNALIRAPLVGPEQEPILPPPWGAPLVAFSPDGGKLAYSSGKGIFIYDFHAHDEQVAQWLREAGVPVPASARGQAPPSSP